MKNAVAVVLGGGQGSRLQPLTKYRSKPAVPLGGKYRLIDIPISNCLNSGLNREFLPHVGHPQDSRPQLRRESGCG